MHAVLKVPKAELIKRLEEARKRKLAAKSEYELALEEAIASIDNRTDETFKVELADWFNAVGEGLENGTITINARGSLQGAPPKPKKDKARTELHQGWRWRWGDYTREQLEYELARYVKERENSVKPIDAALELIRLDTRDEVEIDAADYHKLIAV